MAVLKVGEKVKLVDYAEMLKVFGVFGEPDKDKANKLMKTCDDWADKTVEVRLPNEKGFWTVDDVFFPYGCVEERIEDYDKLRKFFMTMSSDHVFYRQNKLSADGINKNWHNNNLSYLIKERVSRLIDHTIENGNGGILGGSIERSKELVEDIIRHYIAFDPLVDYIDVSNMTENDIERSLGKNINVIPERKLDVKNF
jgi:hypothetical protein